MAETLDTGTSVTRIDVATQALIQQGETVIQQNQEIIRLLRELNSKLAELPTIRWKTDAM